MPIYEYQCDSCGHQFEKLVGFSASSNPSPECPDCQSGKTHKRISTFASLGGENTRINAASSCGSIGPFR